MEESKEIQSIYSIFRVVIYVSLVIEFFEYACNPELLDSFAGVLTDIHERMGRWTIYQPGQQGRHIVVGHHHLHRYSQQETDRV